MCLNHVKITDRYGLSRGYTYFACGKCAACRQALANRRAQKIRNHHPDGFTSYFITLHYRNEFIPYIDKRSFNNNDKTINIYRDMHFDKVSKTYVKGREVIGKIEIKNDYTKNDIRSLSPYRSKYFRNVRKVSVCHTPDWQNFIKRLRFHLQKEYSRTIPISYYYAPEYGPTTQRFHIHALIWFPSWFTESEVKQFIRKAWTFCSKDLLFKYIEVARSASSYVASYLTNDASISPFLLKVSPNKSSHSFHFGFDNFHLSTSRIVKKFLDRRITEYPVYFFNKQGLLESINVPYPKYVLRTLFPVLKGWSRLSDPQRIDVISNFNKYILSKRVAYTSSTDGTVYYYSTIYDVFGQPLHFSVSEWNYFKNARKRALENLPDFSVQDYALLHINFINTYYANLYKKSQSHINPIDNVLEFNNLDMLLKIPDYQVLPDIVEFFDDTSKIVHPDFLPYNITRDNQLLSKFKKNMKTRKLNYN